MTFFTRTRKMNTSLSKSITTTKVQTIKEDESLCFDDDDATTTTCCLGEFSATSFASSFSEPDETWFEDGFFHEQLVHVRNNADAIDELIFEDFVQHYRRDDVQALVELLQEHNDDWEQVTFQESIPGTDYERWQYRKELLKRKLQRAGNKNMPLKIVFEETLDLDMNVMPAPSVVSVMMEQVLQYNHGLLGLSLHGVLAYKDMPAVVNAFGKLIKSASGSLKSVKLSCSFDGELEEYHKWDRKMQIVQSKLQEIASKQGIQMVITLCNPAVDC